MKLRVVGWAYYDDDLPQGDTGWAARHAVVDEIKKHGYLFSGWAHQEGLYCAPVLNDGKIRCFSQRGWGSVMAEAHGHTGRMDYARYAFTMDMEKEVRPTEGFDEDSFMLEADLNERFELDVTQEVFDAAKRSRKIKLDDLPELRYLDMGDTLALRCGDKTAEYIVDDVDRERDLTEEKRWELELAFYDFHNEERMKRAEEEFNNTKVVMIIKLSSQKRKK